MAGIIRHARLETATSRKRLTRGRQPHWQSLAQGRHLGWQRWPDDPTGRWILRTYSNGQYRVIELGKADDETAADGAYVLNFDQAQAKARLALAGPGKGRVSRLTVKRAFDLYVDHMRNQNKSVSDLLSRGNAHILPPLGDRIVEELEAGDLRQWLATMASMPAQTRPTRDGRLRFRPAPKTEEEKRKRLNTSNRTLAILKAVLNFAYDEGHVTRKDAWDRKVKPFDNADAARIRFLEIEECTRLLNACTPEFRPLVRAALETGCRYGELASLRVHHFNRNAGTLAVAKSKTGKSRHVILTADGISFFESVCLGRDGGALMFTRPDGNAWSRTNQSRRMNAACDAARIKPRISFHGLRHTYASHCVMNGVPLIVLAQNLGHNDQRMIERHYGHLSASFVVEAIRAGAPKFGKVTDQRIVPIGR